MGEQGQAAGRMAASAPYRWYVVHTNARSEWLAASRIRDAGYGVFLPHYLTAVRHARRSIAVRRALYSRYLFVGMLDGQSFAPVNNAAGVSAVLHVGDRLLEVPGWVIAGLMMRCDGAGQMDYRDGAVARAKFRAELAAGGLASVIGGTLDGLLLEIEAVDDKGPVQVWIRSMGQRRVVTLPRASVRGVADAPKTQAPERGVQPDRMVQGCMVKR